MGHEYTQGTLALLLSLPDAANGSSSSRSACWRPLLGLPN
jgi:hypothetical protein